MQRRAILRYVGAFGAISAAGCSSNVGGSDVVLEYTITVGKEPEEIPESVRKSMDEGGRREPGNKWVVVNFEVVKGTLDMGSLMLNSGIETEERSYGPDYGVGGEATGARSGNKIKEGGSGTVAYQIPEDADTYEWNLDDARQDVELTEGK